jgi:eukaryotic-like serine/threonine-protein kinase
MIGKTISRYRIIEKLGEGGMGAVYKAEDTKLHRVVALKFLTAETTGSREHQARFLKEAEAAAALEHPNITTIYDIGEEEGRTFIAMSLVEGKTLAQKIVERPLPLEQALSIAIQVGEALQVAHERGVVHRDIKPSNIMITAKGQVKVMDFGLAHLAGQTRITKTGTIMGTPAYMSPEQLEGRTVDRHADIWALGCVLYEMLTQRTPFEADHEQAVAHGILNDEPEPVSAQRGDVQPDLDRILAKALAKPPESRYAHVDDFAIDLRALTGSRRSTETVPMAGQRLASPVERTEVPSPRWRVWLAAAAALLVVALVVSLVAPWRSARPTPQPLMQLPVDFGLDTSASTRYGANTILSPDGSRLVFVVREPDGSSQLYTRRFDQPAAELLPGTEDAHSPFFSPDGGWVAFFAGRRLKKTAVEGGAVVTLCEAPNGRGGSWGEDNRIIAALDVRGGLARVAATGGMPEEVTELDEGELSHRWPQVLRGSKEVLFTAESKKQMGAYDNASLWLQSLETGKKKTIHRNGTYGRYLPSGHLVYAHDNTLFAATFDLDRMQLAGPPVPIVEEVVTSPGLGGAQFAYSGTGMFVYLGEGAASRRSIVQWLDPAGNLNPLLTTPGRYGTPRVSSQDSRLILTAWDGITPDIWVYDWQRDVMSRLTFDAGNDILPVWTPDGNHIAYASQLHGGRVRVRADGSGEAQLLIESETFLRESSFSRDGTRLAFVKYRSATGYDISILRMEASQSGEAQPGDSEPFLQTPFSERAPAFSADGKWLAYQSDESGTNEIYVQSFPDPGDRRQISNGGGRFPVWSPNGRELFYQNPEDKIMVVDFQAEGDSFVADKPRVWSEIRLPSGRWRDFDLAPDGKRFAVIMPAGETTGKESPTLTVLLNFFDELRRRAPVK